MDIIKSVSNNNIKLAVKLLNSAKYRKKEKKFIVEGLRLCKDAVMSLKKVNTLFFTQRAYDKYHGSIDEIINVSNSTYIVSEEVFNKISDTESPQGIACICDMTERNDCIYRKVNNDTFFLGLEDIQNPSNMGTILRTAEALGINGIIMSRGCCDIYSPKVLRGSMGAIFRLNIMTVDSIKEVIKDMQDLNITTCVSVPRKEAVPITNINFKEDKFFMVVGNEGNGLKEETIMAADKIVTIPMLGRAESLNVATATSILIWEMLR